MAVGVKKKKDAASWALAPPPHAVTVNTTRPRATVEVVVMQAATMRRRDCMGPI